MSKKLVFVLLAALALPAFALAADSQFNFTLIPESAEKGLELINLIIALFAAVFAIKLAALSQGGALEKTWNTLAVAAIFFVILEAYGALKGFGFVHVGGLGDILELAFVLVFAYCLFFTKKNLLKKVMG